MVTKLLKHELIYYSRTFGLFLPIVLVVGLMAKVFRLFNSDEPIIKIIVFFSSGMLAVCCFALLILATVACIVRFYTNLFGAEGYLTLTLPVTTPQHIFVKLLAAMICETICLLAVLAAVAIALSGKTLTGLWRDLARLADGAVGIFGTGNCIVFVVEMLLLLAVSAVSSTLLYYACIAIGQTANKHRILSAVAAYFVYYFITQAVSTALTVVISVLSVTGTLDRIFVWTAKHLIASTHIYLCGLIVFSAALAAVFWVITQRMMTRKLNLE